MESIFVTGKTGFVGSHLVNALQRNNYTVSDDSNKCKIWILMAGLMGSVNLQDNIDNNFLLNFKLLKSAKKLPEKIIYISSIDVYDLNTYYAAAKLASENFLRIFCKVNKIKLIILRPSQVYGPKDNGTKVIPKFIDKMNKDEEIELIDRGRAKRQYLYVSDLTGAIVNAVEKDIQGTFNIVGNKFISVKKVLGILEKLMNKRAKIKLAFSPKIEFKEGIKLTLKK